MRNDGKSSIPFSLLQMAGILENEAMPDGPYRPDSDHDGRPAVVDEKGRPVVTVATAAAAQDLAQAMNVGAFEQQAQTLAAIRRMGS